MFYYFPLISLMNAEHFLAKICAARARGVFYTLSHSLLRAKARFEASLHYPGLKAGVIESRKLFSENQSRLGERRYFFSG